jgi:putative MFS transporter
MDRREQDDLARTLLARLDRLPTTRTIWKIVGLLSLAFFFEIYNLLLPGYIAPGLTADKLFTTTTVGLFGTTGIASFVSAMFAGLTLGTACGGWFIDRFGRRASIMWALLEFVIASIAMACADSANLINLCRLIAGIGLGVEMVTINTYISELVPKDLRGRAFATSQAIGFVGVPVVAVLSWLLVPHAPLGISGWRWVVLIGALSAIGAWYIRRNLPESPRWLAQKGRLVEAESVIAMLEARVEAEYGRPLPPPGPGADVIRGGSFAEIWQPPYRKRALMMIAFHIFQTFGYFGFTNWVPAFMVSHGITVTKGMLYTAVIAFAAPMGPILGFAIADRVERKWIIIGGGVLLALAGLAFGATQDPMLLVLTGIVITIGCNLMSFAYHAYQTEIFPTRIRAKAVGLVYSFSRASAMITAFVIAYLLRTTGVSGVFIAIAGAYIIVVLTIGLFGPRTTGLQLEEIAR